MANIAATADDFRADVLVFDYIQRIRPPGIHGDRRGSVDAAMDYLRRFADAQRAVFVVAAVARTKDKKGRSSYDASGLNLASFRESSELEFGADDAFILTPPNADGIVTLKHLKARHGEARDIALEFDGSLQRFTPVAAADSGGKSAAKAQLAALWKSAPAGGAA